MCHISWPSIALVSAIGTCPSAVRVVQSYFYLHPAFLYSNTLSSFVSAKSWQFSSSYPCEFSLCTLLTNKLGKSITFFSPGLRSCIWAHPSKALFWDLTSATIFVCVGLLQAWIEAAKGTLPTVLDWPICSHVDLQIFPPEFEIFGIPSFLDVLTSSLCGGGLGRMA